VRQPGVAKTGEVDGKSREQCYKDMIERLDLTTGWVLQALKDNGLDDNTLVIFISDNGPTGPGSAGPWRGHKGEVFEGGHREPGIVRMPSLIEAGSRSDETILAMDIFPTLLDMAGIKYDAGNKPIDGVSFLPVLTGGKMPDRTLFWRTRASDKAVREGDWKYIETTRKGVAVASLFNLREDPSEQRNVMADNPLMAASLRAKLSQWERSVDAETPEQTSASGKE